MARAGPGQTPLSLLLSPTLPLCVILCFVGSVSAVGCLCFVFIGTSKKRAHNKTKVEKTSVCNPVPILQFAAGLVFLLQLLGSIGHAYLSMPCLFSHLSWPASKQKRLEVCSSFESQGKHLTRSSVVESIKTLLDSIFTLH